MIADIIIINKPEWISYDDIHSLLYLAHEKNRENGFQVKTAIMDSEELKKHVGDNGQLFVALDKDKLVGVTAVRIINKEKGLIKGIIADQILVAVLPEYFGNHISTRLHEQVELFAKKNGIEKIELRTAANNIQMQNACKKWGFHYIDFRSYSGIDHYTIVMMKWLSNCPYSNFLLRIRFECKKSIVKFVFKPGRIRRWKK